jgi:DNA polymerase (family 10)
LISNTDISKIFRQIAYLIDLMENNVNKNKESAVFKTRAYRRAADIIENLSSNLGEIYNKKKLKGLSEIPSVGKSIAIKIEELITTGKIGYIEELKKKTTININEFYNLEGIGIGPKTVKALHDKLRIENLSDLEKAASEGKIHNIPGFSYKKEESILKNIRISQQEGFISVNIHKSLDGTRVVNYTQWRTKEAFEKMLKNPRAIVQMNDALSISKVDGSLYEVVSVKSLARR